MRPGRKAPQRVGAALPRLPYGAVAALAVALLSSPGPAGAGEGHSYEANPGLLRMGGLLLFYNIRAPLSFVTMTPGGLPEGSALAGEVSGRSCQHGLAIPVTASLRPTTLSGAGGDGGYEKALAALRKAHPGLAGIYDVKVDLHTISVLGFYRRVCTEILARGFKIGVGA